MKNGLENIVYTASKVVLDIANAQQLFKTTFPKNHDFNFDDVELLCGEPKSFWDSYGILFSAKKTAHQLKDMIERNKSSFSDDFDKTHLIVDIVDAEVSWLFHVARIAKEEAYNIVRNEKKVDEFCCNYDDLSDIEKKVLEFIKKRNVISKTDLREHVSQISELFEENKSLVNRLIGQFKDSPAMYNLISERSGVIIDSFGEDFFNKLIQKYYGSVFELNKKSREYRILTHSQSMTEEFIFPRRHNSPKIEMRLDDSNPYFLNKNFYSKRVLQDLEQSEDCFIRIKNQYEQTGTFNMTLIRELTDEPNGFLGFGGLLYKLKENSHIASFVNRNSSFKVKEYYDLLDTYISTMYHVARAMQEEIHLLTKYQLRIDELKSESINFSDDEEKRAINYLENKENILKQYQNSRLNDLSDFFKVVKPLTSDLKIALN
ncbi:hypothetical protein JXM83_02735 [Candidatus Woesearchaeota archaeon]|nr:hypothetical protein [Candidatus Woesearchaeota archaeon]